MSHRKAAASLAACAFLACAGLVRAAEPASSDLPNYLADTGPADTSLMGVADKLGVGKPLDDFGLKIGGYAQVGWTYNSRDVQTSAGRVFDFETQDLTL